MYGLVTNSAVAGMSPTQKQTRFMTDSACVAEELKRKCDRSHKHQQLAGGRASKAAIYPEGLCGAICKGLMEVIRRSRDEVKRICVLKATDTVKGEGRHDEEWPGGMARRNRCLGRYIGAGSG